jgi:dipeptidyl aminopeptidase/acylaminoacyl peptidase
MRIALPLLLAAPAVLTAQTRDSLRTADYNRAEQRLPWHASRRVSGDEVTPQFFKDGTRFWYRAKVRDGAEFTYVDPTAGVVRPLFDHARLAAAISIAADTAYDPRKLPFQTLRFTQDGDNEREIEFTAQRKRIVCDLVAHTCTRGDTLPSEVPFVLSPDRKWEAFVVRHDVYVRPRGGGDSTRLTTDGEEFWSYGPRRSPSAQLRESRAPLRPGNIRWAPDSRRLLVTRQDERKVQHHHYVSYTSQRPRHFSQPYALPGDSIVPVPSAHILDREARTNTVVALPAAVLQLSAGGSLRDSVWHPDGGKVHLTGITRASKGAYLFEADATTGQARVLARDTTKTFVEIAPPTDPASWYVTRDGQDVFWWSERDGWGHLYRYGADGALKNRVTQGPWQVGKIVHVDEAARTLWFTARGREPGVPYYQRVYKVGFDGAGLTLLTTEDAYHDVVVSPSGRAIVDRMSRIEQPTVTVLRDPATGRVTKELSKADVSGLAGDGWRPAQVFTAKARDGITDVYGVLYLPPGLDSTKKYPIISHIYPGPQVGSVGAWTFKGGGEAFSLAELGFVVVQIDHLGTPGRSKAFHDAYYGNFIDNGLPDHITVIKQLAARHPFIDLERVGIFGHSGGGFASTDAILRFPEFFKVAVSGAGNHDNRSYNIYWAEKYQGLLTADTARRTDNFAASANKAYAGQLQGKLLLMHGDMDDNVHPAMTVQVVDELIKANKSFDLVWAPNRAHSLNEPYFIRRRWDYFVEHLLGKVPPRDYRITPPDGAVATGDGNVP